ncbi:protein of unknown function (plasmid) [Rhodovastum atsumiense]|uniref:hypothetical protein n=1 Tax=Rhodovastum atsumiense TaxID=504468 RepID=UPI00139F2A18|nr:hypothetical protein [Rhodovastum atsumiense]CAH2606259.1 protein of unknown function [Rhodovastum atsumiense]
MSDPDTTEQVFTARPGSGGEVLVTAPDGRMEFMSLWRFFRFCIAATAAGQKVEVLDG